MNDNALHLNIQIHLIRYILKLAEVPDVARRFKEKLEINFELKKIKKIKEVYYLDNYTSYP